MGKVLKLGVRATLREQMATLRDEMKDTLELLTNSIEIPREDLRVGKGETRHLGYSITIANQAVYRDGCPWKQRVGKPTTDLFMNSPGTTGFDNPTSEKRAQKKKTRRFCLFGSQTDLR
jgi:hypothetical protein